MDLFDVARACLRRWYVLLPIVLITLGWGYRTYSAAEPVYYSQTAIGIAAPSNRIDNPGPGQTIPRNGLLDIGGAAFVANMAALSLSNSVAQNQVAAAGGTAPFSARLFPVPTATQSIPLVLIETTAPDPQTAIRTLKLASTEFDTALASLQRDAQVPESVMLAPFVVAAPSTAVAAMPSRTKSTAMILIGGIGLGILVTVLVDAVLLRRRPKPTRAINAPNSESSTEPESHLPVHER